MCLPNSRPRITAVLLSFLATAAIPGCGPGAVGEVVRPAAPTAGQALGEVDVACRPGATEAEPLVVDLPSSARLDLEVAMKEGVAIVSYDCKSMKLLKGCKLPGAYRFAGVSRKEEVLKLEDQSEIAANLPFSGVQLGGGMEQGSSLDLALVFVGKKSTLVDGAARPELEGRCEGATHFVRAASVGAFALDVGTRGEARAVAEFFGAGASAKSASKRRSMNSDGDLTECRKSTPDDAQPPGQCGSAIRLELLPILASRPAEEEKKPDEKDPTKPLVAACPAGMSMSNGKCTADMDAPFLCQPEDEAQCDAQCKKGSAASCYNLGVIWQKAPSEVKQGSSWEEIQAYHRKRDERYREVFSKACDGGVAEGCDRLGYVLMSLKAPDGEVDDAWQRACNLGHGAACRFLAGRFLYSPERRDVKRGRALLDRGCRLGEAYSCLQLAETYHKPVDGAKPTAEDVAQGISVLKDACTSQQSSCSKLGVLYTEGKVVPKNEAMGLSYYEQSCALGNQMSCGEAGMMVLLGKGASKDPTRAEALFEKACPAGQAKSTCGSLAKVFREGKLVPKDAKRAAGYLERSCASSAIGCMDLADMLLAGEGVARDRDRAIELYAGICGKGGPSGCLKQAALLEATDKARARAIYGETCKGGLVEACDNFKKLGGDPKSLKP